MSLKDFMQQLQEEDNDVVYSTPPEESIQIIPPVSRDQKQENNNSIKVIPPKEDEPKVIKFKLKEREPTTGVVYPKQNTQSPTITPNVVIPPKKENNKKEVVIPTTKIEEKSVKKEVIKQKPVLSEEDKIEEMFIRSETSIDKKEIWLEFYNKALKSNKHNLVTDKCKRGRFMINEENKFVILSDYDTYDKDVNEILHDQWF